MPVIISQLFCIFADLREFVASPPTGWLQKLWCQTSSATGPKVSDTETLTEHLYFHSPGFNDHLKKPFYKAMQRVLRVGLLPAGRTLMSVTGLLAMEELGTFSSSGSWMRGFFLTSWKSKWGERISQGTQNVCFQVEFSRISSSTRWLQKPWPNFP